MEDVDILQHISQLVEEEKRLRLSGHLSDEDRTRVHELEVRLDQCWDLLRRREAREEFGENPSLEHERPASVVEHYEQ